MNARSAHPVTEFREGFARRKVALLGGTTTLGDALLAIGFLLNPARLLQGPSVRDYERAFAAAVGVRHAYSFCAARVGLFGLLRALGIGENDEVLLQVPTHVVVANAIRYTGARPVYVDCRAETYNMNMRDAERKITPRTRALILQHTFGNPADIETARTLADSHRFVLIEDCVHSLGSRFDGRPVGSHGTAAFFSTEETKTITSTMGGMVVTDDPELASSLQAFQARCSPPSPALTARYLIKLILYHFLTEPHLHRYARALYERLGRRQPLPGATSPQEQRGEKPPHYERRLSNAQAALALRQLRRLQENAFHRRRIAEAYRARLEAFGFPLPEIGAKAEPVFLRIPLVVEDRFAVERATAPHAVVGSWFTSVLEEAVLPGSVEYRPGSCPVAESLVGRLVNLPTHPRIGADDVERIVAAVAGVLRPPRPHDRPRVVSDPAAPPLSAGTNGPSPAL